MEKVVYVFLADDFEESEALTTVDVLRRAEQTVKMVSITGDLIVRGAHNISIVADKLFEDCKFENVKALVLPGGMPGADTLGKHKGLLDLLAKYENTETLIAAICAAPMVLGKAGLLEGKKAVAYPGFESHLKGASVQTSAVVVDGKIVTGKGPAAALPFALALAEELAGKSIADSVKQGMCV